MGDTVPLRLFVASQLGPYLPWEGLLARSHPILTLDNENIALECIDIVPRRTSMVEKSPEKGKQFHEWRPN